jgi:hypothetical protein
VSHELIGRAGDHAISRAPFHILIALCAGPRFLVLILQWLAHRHTSITNTTGTQEPPSSAKSTATATRTKAAQRQPEEMVDQAVDAIRKTVEGGDAPPPPPLADIELVVGVIRTFCWCVGCLDWGIELIMQRRVDVCNFKG